MELPITPYPEHGHYCNMKLALKCLDHLDRAYFVGLDPGQKTTIAAGVLFKNEECYHCPVCEKAFCDESRLRQHHLDCHKRKLENITETPKVPYHSYSNTYIPIFIRSVHFKRIYIPIFSHIHPNHQNPEPLEISKLREIAKNQQEDLMQQIRKIYLSSFSSIDP